MHLSLFSTLGLVCALDMLSVVCNQSTLTCLCCTSWKAVAVSLCPLCTGTHIFFLVLSTIFWKAQTPHDLLQAASLPCGVQFCLYGALSTCIVPTKTSNRTFLASPHPVCPAGLALGRMEYMHPAFKDMKKHMLASHHPICCALLSVGRIEYMHPAFKDMKQIILASHHPVCCAVLSLGRIEYLHPAFHDVKNFWPVGYCVDRLAATPASGKKETLHRCQILEALDGSGPLFR